MGGETSMDATEGIIILFGIAAVMVFMIGSLILIKGVKERYLDRDDAAKKWMQRAR